MKVLSTQTPYLSSWQIFSSHKTKYELLNQKLGLLVNPRVLWFEQQCKRSIQQMEPTKQMTIQLNHPLLQKKIMMYPSVVEKSRKSALDIKWSRKQFRITLWGRNWIFMIEILTVSKWGYGFVVLAWPVKKSWTFSVCHFGHARNFFVLKI